MRHLSPSVLFRYQDSRGIARIGYVERTSDHGGTDVTYFMRQWVNGAAGHLDVLSGSRVRDMQNLRTRALSPAQESETLV